MSVIKIPRTLKMKTTEAININDYNYDLPDDRIAQYPVERER